MSVLLPRLDHTTRTTIAPTARIAAYLHSLVADDHQRHQQLKDLADGTGLTPPPPLHHYLPDVESAAQSDYTERLDRWTSDRMAFQHALRGRLGPDELTHRHDRLAVERELAYA